MILKGHLPHHRRLARMGVFNPPMLMLGAQEDATGEGPSIFPAYQTLDLDGGDLQLDLAGDLGEYDRAFQTVYNLGTVEHLWDVHGAFSNAARMVAIGGHYVHHGPVSGYHAHGVHVTGADYVINFFNMNGFEILAPFWFSGRRGEAMKQPTAGVDTILWFAARKVEDRTEFRKPQQVYVGGKPV